MKRLLFTLLFFTACRLIAMDKAEAVDDESATSEAYEPFPTFENFTLKNSVGFYLTTPVQSAGTSRYRFVQGPSSQEDGYCVSLESLLKALETQESTGSVNYLIDENEKHESWLCKVSKHSHTGIVKDPVPTIVFDLKQIPDKAFLEYLKPLASDDGSYQMVRIRAPRGAGTTRNLERLAQRIGFTFLSRKGPLEWRRLSERVFQAKIQWHSPGVAKRGPSGGAGRGNSRKR